MIENIILSKYPNINPISIKEYIDFINTCTVPLESEYGEHHHILPVCLFKEYKSRKDHPWNIKKLNAKDHFKAHYLLYKMIPGKLGYAWMVMWIKTNKNNPRDFDISFLDTYAEEYENLRKNIKLSEETKKKISEASKGHKKSKETRRRMSESLKSRVCKESTRKKRSEINRNRIVSDETRKKMSEARKGKPGTRTGQTQSEATRMKISEWAKKPRGPRKKNSDLMISYNYK